MISANDFKTKASFSRPVEVSDGEGGYTSTLNALGDRSIVLLRGGLGRMTVVADQKTEFHSLTAIVRLDSLTRSLLAGDRAEINGQQYDIQAVRRGLPDDFQNRVFISLLLDLKEEA